MAKQKILVVDDDKAILEMVKFALESEGFEVATATDGDEALNKVSKEKPDLIILDVMMPGIDGFEVCRHLKFDPQYQNVPVIILTAKTEDIDKMTGLEIGADEYITKPFDTKQLIKSVEETLRLKG